MAIVYVQLRAANVKVSGTAVKESVLTTERGSRHDADVFLRAGYGSVEFA